MEMIPASVYQAVATVPGLKRGRTDARETEPVRPVAQADLEVLLQLSGQVAAMVQTQLLTGARPGEVCAMTTAAVDRTRPVWVYRPTQHKTLHHDHVREIRIGPKAQAIVRPFLKLALPDGRAHLQPCRGGGGASGQTQCGSKDAHHLWEQRGHEPSGQATACATGPVDGRLLPPRRSPAVREGGPRLVAPPPGAPAGRHRAAEAVRPRRRPRRAGAPLRRHHRDLRRDGRREGDEGDG